jgi:aspartate/methionine/tyrosine aminotransferase
MKVGWIAGFGPEPGRSAALGRLEVIADTFLSMNTPMQMALPVWLAGRRGIQEQIRERVRGNLASIGPGWVEVLQVGAGWSAVLKVPMGGGGKIEEDLLREVGVVVQPGWFYGMTEAGRVVVSLIGQWTEFEMGIQKISEWVRRNLKS